MNQYERGLNQNQLIDIVIEKDKIINKLEAELKESKESFDA